MDGFEQFWREYPRKVSKGTARKAWAKLKPPAKLVKAMLDALAWQREQEQWRREHGQFIPYPATWLNGERWEDEPPASVARTQQLGDWRFECQRIHGGRCTNVHFHEAAKDRAS